jgi:DNA-binding transcriptional regulator YiaG
MDELEQILLRLNGEGIAHLRKTQGLSQENLARSLGVSVRSVFRWEHDKENQSR